MVPGSAYGYDKMNVVLKSIHKTLREEGSRERVREYRRVI